MCCVLKILWRRHVLTDAPLLKELLWWVQARLKWDLDQNDGQVSHSGTTMKMGWASDVFLIHCFNLSKCSGCVGIPPLFGSLLWFPCCCCRAWLFLLRHLCTALTCSRLPILLSASLHTGYVQTKSKAWGVSNVISTKATSVLCQVA